jgi:hypothetical protein
MIHNEAEYNQMMSDQAQYEAEVAIRMDYENMLQQDAIEFLTNFYGSNPQEAGVEGENFITLIASAFEWADNKRMKK